MKNIFLILCFADFFQTQVIGGISSTLNHQCIHDEIKHAIHYVYQTEQYLDDKYRPLRILLDYTNMEMPHDLKVFVQDKLLKQAVHYLQEVYSIKRVSHIERFHGLKHCGKVKIPKIHRKKNIKGYDMIIYIAGRQSTKGGWIAASSPCVINHQLNKVVAGNLVINIDKFNELFTNHSQIDSLNWIGIMIHEITHLLGFSHTIFRRLGQDKFDTQDDRSWITDNSVVDYAKKYFKCEDIQRIPLENGGNSGTRQSHWEKTTFGNELMTGQDVINFAYSIFTIKTIESIGVLKGNIEKATNFVWGKEEGCKIPKVKCPKGLEFCTRRDKRRNQCSFDYMGSARCFRRDVLCPKCDFWSSQPEKDCRWSKNEEFITKVQQFVGIIGGNSRCWMIKGQPTCYESKCQNNYIEFKVDNQSYKCKRHQKRVAIKINNKIFKIRCPAFSRFCDVSVCNGRGHLGHDENCECDPGFSGVDCEKTIL